MNDSKKTSKNALSKGLKIIGIVVLILCVIAIGMYIVVGRSAKATAEKINIEHLDATGVSDGEYEGRYEVSPVIVSVSVTVADEKIVDVNILEHDNGLGSKAEEIVQDVIEQQRLDVDEISGATLSSKAILKAIENALQSGR